MPELVLQDVTKRYGQGPNVIDQLNTVFTSGSGTGLVGPNGSGKTTLLRLLAVLSFPTSGKITFDGLNIHEHPYEYLSYVGVVPDGPDVPHYLTAVELLEYVLRAHGKWSDEAPAHIQLLLDRVLLDERRDTLLGTYSSGMFAKTQIAAALITEPEVLLMDEPFRALDEATVQAVIELLTEYKDRGGILILASHIRSTLEAVCEGYLDFERRGQVGAVSSY
ncbi:MAG TPA: ABC transporter ATP-binding protein [Rhodothermales bacterium]|nr:ABC transporter ATP-binding protein [Rhodothermales bacterium]